MKVNSRCFAQLSLVSATLLKALVGIRMDALARQFVRKHDTKVKEEIYRLAGEYSQLKEPWIFRL